MWTLPVWVQGRRRVLPSDQVNICIRQKSLKMQLKHVDEQIKPAISEALKKKKWPISHSLKFWSRSSQYSREAFLHAITSWSSLWLSYVHTYPLHCGGGRRTQICPWVCMHTHKHTHTHTHSFYLASAHKGHMDTEILFPTTLERSSHMALLTSTIKRTSPQVDRKEVIKTD